MMGASELDGFDFSKGSFFPPTVVQDIDTDDELWKEEVFGPVVVTKSFAVSFFGTFLFTMGPISCNRTKRRECR